MAPPIPQIVNSPVSCLHGNVVSAFEKAVDTATLREVVNSGTVRAGIELDQAAIPPRTPYTAGASPSTIYLGLSFLEALWAYTYGLFALQEHQMRLASYEWGVELGGPEHSPETLRRARSLLTWARSLPACYSFWPHGLPSPKHHESKEEAELAAKTNTIFQSAIACLLHHELAHAVYGHMANGTRAEILEREKEADLVAYSRFFEYVSTQRERRIVGWSILVPHLYGLEMARTPSALFARTHLHVHHRLTHALAHLDYADPHDQDYFGMLCADVIRAFYLKHRIDPRLVPGTKFDRVGDLLQYLVDCLDRLAPDSPPN